MNIYVGNLSFDASEDDIRQLFSAHGEVSSVNIIADKYSGRSKGFAFVEMPQQEQAQAALQGLNGKDFKGRPLNVSEAKPKGDRPQSQQHGGGKRW